MGRSARRLILSTAMLLCWAIPMSSSAQSQPLPAPRPFRIAREAAAPAATVSEVSLRPSIRLPSEWSPQAPGSPGVSTPLSPGVQQPAGEEGFPTTGALEAGQGGFEFKIKPAPLEPTDLEFPINLATALRLSDARPLVVAAAQASVWVAEAELTRAKVLWVPQLNIGGDYIRHDGGGPDFNKGLLTAPSVNFFYGGGGLWEIVSLTDVFFEPLVRRQTLNSRQWDIQAAKNDALVMTARAYFDVHQHRGRYAGALYCVERGHDLVNRIASLSHELVPIVEVDRARNLLADLEQQATADARPGGSKAPASPACSGSTLKRSSFRSNLITFRSR